MKQRWDQWNSGALFSPCRTWRYMLYRQWEQGLPFAMFIGLNPSTADEHADDPTVRRCIQYAKDWGFGGLWMLNLFAYRATDPAVMKTAPDPVGPDNYKWLVAHAKEAGVVVAAWGNHGEYLNRSKAMRKRFPRHCPLGIIHHLGLTKTGEPKHPLYLKKNLKPMVWSNL